jgi:hypothetical protein
MREDRTVAYEWVGPVATSATGIAGVAFTWLASRNAGKDQLTLMQEGHAHDSKTATRQERKEEFTALMAALSEANEMLAEAGQEVALPFARGAAKAGWKKGDEPAGEGFIPPQVLAHLDIEDSSAIHTAAQKCMDHLAVWDDRMFRVRLCGSDRVVAAANAVRDDYLAAIQLLARGDWRYIKAAVSHELLNAFRVDLGYPESEMTQRPEARPAGRALDLK